MNAVLRLRRFATAYSRSLVAYAIVAILWIAASLMIAGFGAYAHLRYIVELAAVIGLVGMGQTIAVIGGGHRSIGRRDHNGDRHHSAPGDFRR